MKAVTKLIRRKIGRKAALGAAFCAGLAPVIVIAQDRAFAPEMGDGGLYMRLRIAQRLEADTNPSLQPDTNNVAYQSLTQLTYALESETATQMFKLNAIGGLRIDTDDGTVEAGMTDPRLDLHYGQYSPASTLTANLRFRRANLTYYDPLAAENRSTSGALDADFEDITGDGTRQTLRFDASLSVGDDAPFGMTFGVDLADTKYTDVTIDDLVDSTRATASAAARFDITKTLSATTRLHYTNTSFDTDADINRYGIDLAAQIETPTAAYGLTYGLVDGDGGIQNALHLSHSFVRPSTTFTGRIGATQATSGQAFITGGIDLEHERADTKLRISADRSLGVNFDDNEEIVTSLSLGAIQRVSDVGRVIVTANYALNDETETGDITGMAGIDVTYAHALTPDWSVDAGINYRVRDRNVGGIDMGRADSTAISLTLRREFDLRR